MLCPRCGNEWDASKSPCTRCGLVIRIPGQAESIGRGSGATTLPQQSGKLPTLRSQSSGQFGVSPANNAQPNAPASLRASTMLPNLSQFPPATQSPDTPRPFYSSPVPETPRPSSFSPSISDLGNNHILNRTLPQAQPKFGWIPTQSEAAQFEILSPKNVPPRPQTTSPFGRTTDSPQRDLQRPPNTPRPSRLVTDPSARVTQRAQGQMPPLYQQNNASPFQNMARPAAVDTRQLLPGTILRGGRYRLRELQESQEWLSGVRESTWIAQDAQRGASQVMISEVVLPDSGSVVMQSILRTATMALTSVGRHPHIPTLWDAFSDRGRNFFVFEAIDGESLMSRMRRTGRALQEQEIIECCLQMTELLELLSQQSPPLVHGFINPEHIVITRSGFQYVLTTFSIVLAGGATQFISGIDRTRLSVYTAPEFVRGVIDVRSDLFSLMATAYHAVTGSVPAGVSGSIPQAQRINPNVTPQFDAILAKGLRPVASQRYQRPSELRQDLLAMRSVSGTLVPGAGQRFEPPFMSQPMSIGRQSLEPTPKTMPESVVQTFQSLAPSEDEEQKLLLPRPEELPALQERNDKLFTAFWLGGIVVCLLLIIILAGGFS